MGNSGLNRLIRILLPLSCALGLFALLWYWQRPDDESGFYGNNLVLFALVNFNIVLLCVLAFLIGRNLVKLIFDRKNRILGSVLKLRLVSAFVILTLVPTVILFFLASGLLNKAMEGWFSTQVETAVEGAVEVARQHFNELKENTRRESIQIKKELEADWADKIDPKLVNDFLEKQRTRWNMYGIKIYDSSRKSKFEVFNAAAVIESFSEPEPDSDALQKALNSETNVLTREKQGGQFIEVYSPLLFGGTNQVLLVSSRVNPELSHALSVVLNSKKEYSQLKLFKGAVKSGYLLILAMITGSILFAAIWTGFYIARLIVVPIQRLAEGTREVASGNLGFRIDTSGDDEIGLLVNSFNQMTSDLKSSREIAERRRLFLETILANLAVGVVALDNRRRITSINNSAARLYSIEDSKQVVGKDISELMKAENFEPVESLIVELETQTTNEEATSKLLEKQFSLTSSGRERQIVCTAGRIIDLDQKSLGMLLLFDDITELAKAQNMAVWREVARRIAHEIKNPLTPIQLSAQRLERLIGEEKGSVKDSVQTIVENVDSIKRLANEFSNFARMPTAEFQPANLNAIIADTITPYAESQTGIIFQFIGDNKMPEVRIDREQVRRVLINLIENAVDAVLREPGTNVSTFAPRITIKSFYDRKRKTVSFEVSDNGPGIAPSDKVRVFEPYFTTKKKGTGLGLAIVTSIVSDHQGDIKLYDNAPRGAKFVVELPLAPKDSTQRRLAAGEV